MSAHAELQTPEQTIALLERRIRDMEAEHALEVERLRGEVQRWYAAAQSAEIDTENAEAELRVARRRLKMAKREEQQSDKKVIADKDVQAAFDYWQVATGRTRSKLDGKRARAVKARLEHGHTLEEIKHAIDGAGYAAFEKEGRRFDDLELICRDESRFDSFRDRRRAHLARELQGERLEAALRVVCGDPRWDPGLECWEFRCPACRTEFDHETYKPLRIFADDGTFECHVCKADANAVREALIA